MPNVVHNRRGFAASGAVGALLVTLLGITYLIGKQDYPSHREENWSDQVEFDSGFSPICRDSKDFICVVSHLAIIYVLMLRAELSQF